jgi:hypothetical protein
MARDDAARVQALTVRATARPVLVILTALAVLVAVGAAVVAVHPWRVQSSAAAGRVTPPPA